LESIKTLTTNPNPPEFKERAHLKKQTTSAHAYKLAVIISRCGC